MTMKSWFAELGRECYLSFCTISIQVAAAWALYYTINRYEIG